MALPRARRERRVHLAIPASRRAPPDRASSGPEERPPAAPARTPGLRAVRLRAVDYGASERKGSSKYKSSRRRERRPFAESRIGIRVVVAQEEILIDCQYRLRVENVHEAPFESQDPRPEGEVLRHEQVEVGPGRRQALAGRLRVDIG